MNCLMYTFCPLGEGGSKSIGDPITATRLGVGIRKIAPKLPNI